MPNPFQTLDSCVRSCRVLLPTPRDGWRLVVDPVMGHIQGLDGPSGRFSGLAVATNGVMVMIVNDQLGSAMFGHLEWFIPNQDQAHAELSDLWDDAKIPTNKTKKPKIVKSLEYYTGL